MTLPVRIEGKAWADSRYRALALELGLADARFALIMVADIWRWQTEHYTDDAPTYCVSRAVIVGALASKTGPEALVAADLAEAMPDGTYRIKGGRDDKGGSRIDWYYRDRQQRSAAGKASAARRTAAGTYGADTQPSQRPTDVVATEPQRASNGTPTGPQRGTDSLISDLRTPDSLFSEQGRSVSATPTAPDRIADLWGEQERLRRETIPDSRPLTLTADRRKRIATLLKSGHSVDDLRACLNQYAIEARGGAGEWFNGDTNWRPDNVQRALGRIGTQQRAGPSTRGQPTQDTFDTRNRIA